MRFSVIVPVYNVEMYLDECIESLLNQTYLDYEIILIDDGSIDNSGNICDKYTLKDNKKINVIHKKNGGLSDARNVGIENAKGEYLVFVDSDDYICDCEFLEKIDKKIIKDECDLIIFGNKKLFENKNKLIEKKYFNNEKEVTIAKLIEVNYFKACAWDKIIRKDFLIENNIMFPVGRYSEDIEWCAKILKKIDYQKISLVNENFYVYRQRENSLTKKVNEKFIRDIFEMIKSEIVDSTDSLNIVNSFLAYEYTVLLGWCSIKEISNDLYYQILDLKGLLKFNISKKVKIVNKVVSILGIKNTGFLLGKFIEFKN